MPKDACYRKVKAKFKVFPSAYAGGAIAKCRKVGAANYGNKSKKKAEGGVITAKNGKAFTKRKSKTRWREAKINQITVHLPKTKIVRVEV